MLQKLPNIFAPILNNNLFYNYDFLLGNNKKTASNWCPFHISDRQICREVQLSFAWPHECEVCFRVQHGNNVENTSNPFTQYNVHSPIQFKATTVARIQRLWIFWFKFLLVIYIEWHRPIRSHYEISLFACTAKTTRRRLLCIIRR